MSIPFFYLFVTELAQDVYPILLPLCSGTCMPRMSIPFFYLFVAELAQDVYPILLPFL
jgi:hypothetical protein